MREGFERTLGFGYLEVSGMIMSKMDLKTEQSAVSKLKLQNWDSIKYSLLQLMRISHTRSGICCWAVGLILNS